MKKTLTFVIGLLFAVPAFALPVPTDWLVCDKDSDCTSAIKDCRVWQPVNVKYEDELIGLLQPCEANVFAAGYQPSVKCVKRQCVQDYDYTNVSVRDWFRDHKDKLSGSVGNAIF